MMFSSLFFLYLFLPLTLICYYVVNPKYRNAVLIVFSLVFYAWGEPVFLWLLLISTLLHYLFGRLISANPQSRAATISLIASLIFNIGMLALFKYTVPLVETINSLFSVSIPVPAELLPIGLSFYTFRAISYTIDCHQGKIEAEQKFSHFLLYMTFFPIALMGPVARYETMQNQLTARRFNLTDIGNGLMRTVVGLGKKVILADQLGRLADQFLGGDLTQQTMLGAWLGVIAFTLQLYFDLSGYADMAIGISGMLGFHLDETFRHPFTAANITDFWQRWHISLQTFFQRYAMQIPLFGRTGTNINLILMWLLLGLWHGAGWHFVLWGMYMVLLLFAEQMLRAQIRRIPISVQHIGCKLFLLIGFAMFYFEDMGKLGACLKCMFGLGGNGIADAAFQNALLSNLFLLAAAILCCFPLLQLLKRVMQKSPGTYLTISVCGTVLAVVILIVSSVLLVSGADRPFLYLQF